MNAPFDSPNCPHDLMPQDKKQQVLPRNMDLPCHKKFGDFFVRRVFLPVGQGAFYCERFHAPDRKEPFTLVYDCGVMNLSGKQQRKALRTNFKDVLNRHFPVGLKTINALYISHLDSDHINGLRLLREHGVKIERFFLPGIEDEDRWLKDLWFEVMDPDGPAWGIFRDPSILGVMFPGVQVTIVRPTIPPRDPAPLVNPYIVELVKWVPEFANSPFHDWVFDPFNLRRDEYIDKLKAKLAKALDLPGSVTNEELHKQWEEKGQDILEDVIRGVYAEDGVLPRNGPTSKFNSNSMVLFSGPAGKHVQTCQIIWKQAKEENQRRDCRTVSHLCSHPPGCLYTGDYDAKHNMVELLNAYAARLDNIGCVQIPHHGSYRSFHADLLKHDAIFVVSAGLHSPYRHPNKDVRVAFQKEEKKLHCVTENPESCLCVVVCCDKKGQFGRGKEATFVFEQDGRSYLSEEKQA